MTCYCTQIFSWIFTQITGWAGCTCFLNSSIWIELVGYDLYWSIEIDLPSRPGDLKNKYGCCCILHYFSEESSAPPWNNAVIRKGLQGSFLLSPLLSLRVEASLDGSNIIHSHKKRWSNIFVVENSDKQKEERAQVSFHLKKIQQFLSFYKKLLFLTSHTNILSCPISYSLSWKKCWHFIRKRKLSEKLPLRSQASFLMKTSFNEEALASYNCQWGCRQSNWRGKQEEASNSGCLHLSARAVWQNSRGRLYYSGPLHIWCELYHMYTHISVYQVLTGYQVLQPCSPHPSQCPH